MTFSNAINSVPGIFGDGSDGSQTFDGSSIVLGLTPAANVYTLARDIFLSTSTIDNGVSIITNGYRIFCRGTLTNNGTISWNGNNAALGTAGAAVFNTTSSINTNGAGGASPGTAGGNGNTGAGSNGTNGSLPTFGGVGGVGGTGGSAGGNGGTATALLANQGNIRHVPQCIQGQTVSGASAFSRINGGTGGGGGGGDGVNVGGGGGGGGAIVILSVFLFGGTGNIQAIGGNGANGAVAGTNCGGGGGGGGGIVIIVSRSVTNASIAGQTVSVAGGTQGTGSGTGANGLPGNTGTTILLNM